VCHPNRVILLCNMSYHVWNHTLTQTDESSDDDDGSGGNNNSRETDENDAVENQTVSCCFGAGYNNPIPSRPWQTAAHRFVEGRTRHGRVFQRFMLLMIVLTVVAVVAESVQGVYDASNAAFDVFEFFSVGVFTVDYLLRLFGASQVRLCRCPSDGPF
jgi:hypothetical protein